MNTQFYLTAKSNPIIEHCSQMGFGPFIQDKPVFDYDGMQGQAEQAGLVLEPEKNFYSRVLDFNWHKQDKSPNWDVIGFSEELCLKVWLIINKCWRKLRFPWLHLCLLTTLCLIRSKRFSTISSRPGSSNISPSRSKLLSSTMAYCFSNSHTLPKTMGS